MIVAANEAHFCNSCRNIGHFICVVERVKRFVNVHLHCIASNLKRISKMSTLPPWKSFCGRPYTPHLNPGIGKHLAVARCPSVKNLPAVRKQVQIGPKVSGTTDIRNTLRVPLTDIIPTGRSILLRQSKPRSLTKPMSLTSCCVKASPGLSLNQMTNDL